MSRTLQISKKLEDGPHGQLNTRQSTRELKKKTPTEQSFYAARGAEDIKPGGRRAGKKKQKKQKKQKGDCHGSDNRNFSQFQGPARLQGTWLAPEAPSSVQIKNPHIHQHRVAVVIKKKLYVRPVRA